MRLPACVRRVPTVRCCCRNSLVHCATKKLCGPVAVQLGMPVGYRIHDVFYVSLIKPCKARPEGGACQRPALVVEGNVYGAVNTILQHRQRKVGRVPLRAWLTSEYMHSQERFINREGANGMCMFALYDSPALPCTLAMPPDMQDQNPNTHRQAGMPLAHILHMRVQNIGVRKRQGRDMWPRLAF